MRMKKPPTLLLAIIMALSLTACSKTANDTVGSADDAELSAVENTEQTTFSSDDWNSWEFKVNGQLLELPCSLVELYETGTWSISADWVLDEDIYTWFLYDPEQGYEAGSLNGNIVVGAETPSEQREDIAYYKVVGQISTFVNYYADVPFEVTLPGNITWGEPQIEEAVTLWGEPDSVVEAGESPLTNYFWYSDPEIGESSGFLDIGFYEDTGIIGYIKLKCPGNSLNTKVKIAGEEEWSNSVVAKAGDEVEFRIEYINLTGDSVADVVINNVLPSNIAYVEDSTYLYNASYQDGLQLSDNTVTTSGINIGSYSQGGNAYVCFTGKVLESTFEEVVDKAIVTVNEEATIDSVTMRLD